MVLLYFFKSFFMALFSLLHLYVKLSKLLKQFYASLVGLEVFFLQLDNVVSGILNIPLKRLSVVQQRFVLPLQLLHFL